MATKQEASAQKSQLGHKTQENHIAAILQVT